MNYPVWELTTLGGGSLIALIAILHVYIAHLAVGGGLFIWLTDRKGYLEKSPEIHHYVHKHTWFFLLLTMVFGGLSGVGIWFIIALVNPAATSALIHNFVFGWAIEWVFFLCEITALLVYYYKFDSLERKPRLTLAFLYFLFAWLSLVIINGIISFMLTPGKWLQTGNFWHGFFNPTFFSSLVFRTFAACMIAGLFAYITCVFLKEGEFRSRMMKYATKWLLYPVAGLIPSGIWYYLSVPPAIRSISFSLNPQTVFFTYLFLAASILIFVSGVILSRKISAGFQKGLAFVLVIIGLLWMGGFEYMREISRKPYIITDYMYSTSVLKSDTDKLNHEGFLKNSKWKTITQITPENSMKAGEELFKLQCLSCHTVNGIRNDITPATSTFNYLGILSHLTGQGKIQAYMPPFMGTAEEKDALATYIIAGIQQKPVEKELQPYEIIPTKNEIPKFDRKRDEYILLVWNDLGMHCISDCDPWFVILPPANTLEAQLIKRGALPQIINEGVRLTYRVESGYENPSGHVKFWDYSSVIFRKVLDKNVGLFGNGMSGDFKYNEEHGSFIAQAVPVVPYKDDGGFNPYPIFIVEAHDSSSGKLLIRTAVAAPASTEMGCKNCHGGDWRMSGVAGVSNETAINILKVHDRLNQTSLYYDALNGQPRLCSSCHQDVALGQEGKPELLSLSAAIHGWHANYMPVQGGQACAMCHPAFARGRTRCSRGVHGGLNITCVDCHGELSDHALALLKGQQDKRGAARLMARLSPVKVIAGQDINPRLPWIKQPDCLTCHVEYQKPEAGVTAYNIWNDDFSELYRMRTDYAGIRCEGCHHSTHAEYPAVNPFGKDRDNIQPLQYSGQTLPIGSNMSCEVCHMQKMEDPIHHENMYRPFRNMALVD
jgi:cytochrome bd-type quinol oxidase subunit 1